jgi:hypothetical protein
MERTTTKDIIQVDGELGICNEICDNLHISKIDISKMKLHSLSHILIIKPRLSVVGEKKGLNPCFCFSEWLQNGPHPLEKLLR